MKRWLVLSFVLVLVGAVIPAAAQTVPDIRGIQPFSAESNYMSLEGYLRYQYYQQNQNWVSVAQAKQLVIAQIGTSTTIASGGIVRPTSGE